MDNPPCIVDFLMKTSKDQGDIAMFDFRENALILITVTSNNHESPLSTIKSELLLVLKSPTKNLHVFLASAVGSAVQHMDGAAPIPSQP